ncbi:transposase, partial [Desulforhabdus sp. TSK]|uniref:transposase n=1 Tax=Desulforhabdus sp. TSK TaxID=2925014 RepID=UPI0034D4D68E
MKRAQRFFAKGSRFSFVLAFTKDYFTKPRQMPVFEACGNCCKKNLYIKFLPTYSPELNLIEILWRKIKYEWLSFSAYLSFSLL